MGYEGNGNGNIEGFDCSTGLFPGPVSALTANHLPTTQPLLNPFSSLGSAINKEFAPWLGFPQKSGSTSRFLCVMTSFATFWVSTASSLTLR
jgi:hypothetical protein